MQNRGVRVAVVRGRNSVGNKTEQFIVYCTQTNHCLKTSNAGKLITASQVRHIFETQTAYGLLLSPLVPPTFYTRRRQFITTILPHKKRNRQENIHINTFDSQPREEIKPTHEVIPAPPPQSLSVYLCMCVTECAVCVCASVHLSVCVYDFVCLSVCVRVCV